MFASLRLAAAVFTAGLILAALIPGRVPAAPTEEKPAEKPAAPTTGAAIDLAICLDVSGSMQGLIDSAKAKLWDVVNQLAQAKPTPNLRVALYTYGRDTYDRNKGWVQKDLDLTNDLDEVSKKLFGMSTNGGEEYVARVTQAALTELKWSTDKDALKIVFVCGNESATQDPAVKLEDVATQARKQGVIVNTIYCHPAGHPEAKGWSDFATAAEGAFAVIDQAKGTKFVAAPQDDKLADLSAKLNKTYVAYGDAKERDAKQANQGLQDQNAEKLDKAVAAQRASSKANGLYRNDAWDLIDRMKNDPKFDITKLKEEELCDEMKKLKPEERAEFVKKKAAEREEIQKAINELATARAKYVAEEEKKTATKGEKALDEALRATLRKQAAGRNIQLPE